MVKHVLERGQKPEGLLPVCLFIWSRLVGASPVVTKNVVTLPFSQAWASLLAIYIKKLYAPEIFVNSLELCINCLELGLLRR